MDHITRREVELKWKFTIFIAKCVNDYRSTGDFFSRFLWFFIQFGGVCRHSILQLSLHSFNVNLIKQKRFFCNSRLYVTSRYEISFDINAIYASNVRGRIPVKRVAVNCDTITATIGVENVESSHFHVSSRVWGKWEIEMSRRATTRVSILKKNHHRCKRYRSKFGS